jgi:hypothetical protein
MKRQRQSGGFLVLPLDKIYILAIIMMVGNLPIFPASVRQIGRIENTWVTKGVIGDRKDSFNYPFSSLVPSRLPSKMTDGPFNKRGLVPF